MEENNNAIGLLLPIRPIRPLFECYIDMILGFLHDI